MAAILADVPAQARHLSEFLQYDITRRREFAAIGHSKAEGTLRCMQSGEECVLGVKVTGDPNVPAGNVSFRALIGRKHRTSGWDVMYPPELDVQARYPGEGRVAQQGFKDAW